jgi:Fe-S-cluster-containing hydrogenase component 2
MRSVRKIIKIDEELCNGCGQCVPDCAEGSLAIVDGKAKLMAERYCDGLGACLGACPTGALTIVEREAEDFDEEAVEAYLAAKEEEHKEETVSGTACGCPSSQLQTFIPKSSSKPAIPSAGNPQDSALSHWPIQIRLIPPQAPFLKNADLLIVADCAAVAVPGFQEKYMAGKTVMMGCPKFDDAEGYIRRFTDIIKTCNIKSMTILIMEVPCCSAMNVIIKRAMEKAGTIVPVEQVTISTRGEELARVRW